MRNLIHIITFAMMIAVMSPSLTLAAKPVTPDNPTETADGRQILQQQSDTIFPIAINEPGSYVLVTNITLPDPSVNAIEISADDVILDLNGHTISGPGAAGISATEKRNVFVANGTIRDFSVGVRLTGISDPSANRRLDNVHVFNNSTGIWIERGVVRKCSAAGNGTGINARYSILDACRVANNTVDGILASSSSITSNYISDNDGSGISLRSTRSTGSIITGCDINNNGWHGIYSPNTPNGNAYISNNNIRGNGTLDPSGHGIFLQNNNNYVIKNAASGNQGGNFHVDDPSNNYMPTDLDAPDAANANIGW